MNKKTTQIPAQPFAVYGRLADAPWRELYRAETEDDAERWLRARDNGSMQLCIAPVGRMPPPTPHGSCGQHRIAWQPAQAKY